MWFDKAFCCKGREFVWIAMPAVSVHLVSIVKVGNVFLIKTLLCLVSIPFIIVLD